MNFAKACLHLDINTIKKCYTGMEPLYRVIVLSNISISFFVRIMSLITLLINEGILSYDNNDSFDITFNRVSCIELTNHLQIIWTSFLIDSLTLSCIPSFIGMYIIVLIMWMIWIPLHFISSIRFDIFPITLMSVYTVTFLFLSLIGTLRYFNNAPFFPTPIFVERKSFLNRSFTSLILVQYIFGETVLHFLPTTQTASFFYKLLHILCPILLLIFIYLPLRKHYTMGYTVLAIVLPLSASYFALGHNFGIQYYFFFVFYCIFSIGQGIMLYILYPTLPDKPNLEILME
ncbi:hypothetical protein EDI_024430 [Entamoeba dispar SAW760]|uniref:Uncharacterized protein n=1 Tax=Entamoeba dispar (strain ATCC PRA-260 / SAW760) TaxID=370354 RepID=B0EHF0_ENTDS|nr:uncharacterized protein EDI_024430 [Entamoeba dispar SAW760]EDR26055.1 hypothetical protein EDI_024430 [Entamoeba dispar SAW760]|eukprot:EDR26055.1 hypothetical protein EDI_024430 [Entamoeba dispar SAW760]